MVFARRSRWFGRLPLTALLAVLVVVPPRAAYGQESRSLKERFLAEAPKAWEQYQSFAARLSGTMIMQATITELNGKVVPSRKMKIEYKQKEGHRLYAIESMEEPTFEASVLAANPRYAFRLKPPKDKTDWLLAHLDLKVLDGTTVDLDAMPLSERIHQSVAMHFEASWIPLSTRIRHPTFKVLRATAVTQDGHEFERIDFDNGDPLVPKKGPYDGLKSGSLLFDPDHFWCLVECAFAAKQPARDGTGWALEPYKTTYKYRDGTGGFPILTRAVMQRKVVSEKKIPGLEYIYEYDLRESPEPEEEEFTLTAYGLPEPVGMELPRRSRTWLWFGLAGVAALGVGFLIRRVGRRRATSHSAASQAPVLK